MAGEDERERKTKLVKALRESGKTYAQIAKECELSEWQVKHIIKKNGLAKVVNGYTKPNVRIEYLKTHCKELPCLRCHKLYMAEHSPTTGKRIHWLCMPCRISD
jgi:hypothetical protein